MQVFVSRSQLSQAGNDTVPVIASYDDSTVIDPSVHGPGVAILSLPPAAIANPGMGGPILLAPGWRAASRDYFAAAESRRRIEAAFPDDEREASLAELMTLMIEKGTDSIRWPAAAQRRRDEFDRCWAYVRAVKEAATSMQARALPPDPTADAHWPTRIARYKSG